MSIVNRINPLLAKTLLIVGLSLALLLPLGRMESLIAERSALRDSAVERIAHGVGHAQSIGAVMMIVPVTRTWVDGGKDFSETKSLRVLAESVDVTGNVSTELRKSGIYTVPTFKAALHVSGSISSEPLTSRTDRSLEWTTGGIPLMILAHIPLKQLQCRIAVQGGVAHEPGGDVWLISPIFRRRAGDCPPGSPVQASRR
jgi:inner membrane protein involved in colicin E2 resistance